MCLYPKLIKNKRYTITEKNGGIIPPLKDKRVLVVPASCGKCMECTKKKGREWRIRLKEEIKNNKNAHFVTFTFSNEEISYLYNKYIDEFDGLTGYNLDNAIAGKAIRLFTENYRKKNKKAPKHWLVTELGKGKTEHLHIHGIVWGEKENIEKAWIRGHSFFGYSMNEKVINYVIKYIHKKDDLHKEFNGKVWASKGIGRNYLDTKKALENKYNGEKTREYYREEKGNKIAMPTYWRNKLYTDEEKEELWLNKLNQQIRYVDGVKIDISKGEEEYYRHLKQAQKKNIKLGYSNDEKNWELKKYENERRQLKIEERIEKGKLSLKEKELIKSIARGHA